MTTQVDMGGDDLIVETIHVGATTPGNAGTDLTATNLGFLSVTPGTATASKAVVLNSSKNIATLGTVGCGTITITDASNIVVGSSTGSKIGTATTQKLGFFNAAPVAQQTAATTTTGFTASTGTTVVSGSTFTGNSGSTAYTIGDVVLALKNLGLIAV